MSSERIITCDKCEQQTAEDYPNDTFITLFVNQNKHFPGNIDLCQDCAKELIEFLAPAKLIDIDGE